MSSQRQWCPHLIRAGFCGPGIQGEPDRCYDAGNRCRGTYGGVECTCAAAGHYEVPAAAA